jgi:SAM-dependent methyltransferase
MATAGDTDLTTAELALVWAARETGLLEALLRQTGSPSEAAAVAGVTERAARVTVDALVELGFFKRMGDGVEPTNRALGLLATRDVRSIGQVPAALDRLDALARLPDAMRRDEPDRQPRSRTAQESRHRLGANEALDDATVRATVDAIHAANPDADRVLALADGPGRHARELSDRGPAVTMLEGPTVADAVGPLLARSDVALETGSLADVEAAAWDLVFLVDGLWSGRGAENRYTIQSVERALAPGGAFVAVEPLRDRSDAATDVAATALATGSGEPYSEATIAGWCVAAGLDDVSASEVPGTPYQAVVAERHED